MDGTWITDPHQVKSAFLNFFKAKCQEMEARVSFKGWLGASTLNDSDRAILECHVSMDEIKVVIWDCGSNKAPGLDARTSILVNGSPSLVFSIKCGLRQGDPLSPFLFIIVMEGLHLAINEAIQTNLIRGAVVGAAEFNGYHFFFADDVVIVTEWTNHDMDNLKRVLHVFHLASGLKINMHKSNVFGVGVPREDVVAMARRTGCEAGSFPFKYLGLPVGSNINRIDSWSHLVSKFNDKLSNWKANLLPSEGD
ncbi:putative RNA-directed DNA polymerase, eukaryota, reverse transcriptase zinc-binding domain protein [Tanacetum coccineum]